MNEDNVVPFDPSARAGMARRGAPDKSGAPSAAPVALSCPSCAAEFRLQRDWLAGESAVLCGRCGGEIPLVGLRRESGAG